MDRYIPKNQECNTRKSMADNFGLPNDGLANPALQRRKSKNRDAEKLLIIIRFVMKYLVVMYSEFCRQEESKSS